jgi:hypothetical protein
MNLLDCGAQLILADVCEKAASHKTISLTPLRDGIVTEALERIAELVLLQLFPLWQGQRTVGVLRCWVNIIDQVRSVLIACHIRLKLVVLGLRSVEISSKRHRGRVEKQRCPFLRKMHFRISSG